MQARKGYQLAKITERTVSGAAKRFQCGCGAQHTLASYVYAHWQEKLWHHCECGRRNIVQNGVVQTPNKV